MELGSSSGVRKGAWSKIEDELLKLCIQNYGEGKWHLVPQRAGLNRCRKSCRLRWLNYLKPDIKRGDFSEDEVDLLIRMHKLLGNRWSLIAGRLPGRTANDVKNYWNTYMRRKLHSQRKGKKVVIEEKQTVKPHEVIKPQPQTFSKKSPWLQGKKFIPSSDHSNINSKVGLIGTTTGANSSGSTKNNYWWENLLDDNANSNNVLTLDVGDGALIMNNNDVWDEQHMTSIATNACDFLTDQGKTTWSDDLMNLLDNEIFNLGD